ncbi:hypothetical protein DL98DRAFT_2378 [Cadophora sp. DSE1049]|nr:hypothetical protein DL98DRAFT_2378 [Cadophora sp. DSE1049]
MNLQKRLLALAAASLPLAVHACMEFNGTLPFSHTSPFEASITDNGVVTCWISTTLAEHNSMQDELFSHQHSHNWKAKSKLKKRSVGRKISLTDLPAYDPSSSSSSSSLSSSSKSQYKSLPGSSSENSSPVDEMHVDLHHPPPPHNGELPKTQKMEELQWDDIPVWQPWNFECISGHKAKANVGMRGFTYVAHGQDFHFVPKMREDVWGERWVYSLRLWCGEKDKQKKVVERPKPKGEGQGDGGKKKEGKSATAGGGGVPAGDVGNKKGGGGKSSTSGGSVAKSGLKE